MQLEIERLARLVRKLHRWGYAHVHIITDHGFILLDEQTLPREVQCDKSWRIVLKERYAIVSGQQPVEATLKIRAVLRQRAVLQCRPPLADRHGAQQHQGVATTT